MLLFLEILANRNCNLFVVALVVCGLSLPSAAQESFKDKIPLIEREPFDLIKLDEINGNVEIEIKPLEQPLPDPLPAQGVLIFESPDLSDDRLQVPYQNIVSYKSYNDLLRSEANQHIRNEDFGKAFRNLIYVYDHGGKSNQAITKTIQELLFRDGAKNYLAGNFELALTIFQDIYDRDKNFSLPNVKRKPVDLILDCRDKNIAASFEAGLFGQVRAALSDLELRYSEDAKDTIAKWQNEMLKQSDDLLAEARRLAADGNGKLAHLTARRANSILPGRKEALALFQEIVEQYPIVFVGVSQRTENGNPLSLDNWGQRRVGKLTQRSVVEFTGPGDDGGNYKFLNGSINQIDDDGYVFRFTIEPSSYQFATPPINAYALSRKMLARGSIRSEEYNIPFAKVVESIQIEDEQNVVVKLKKAFVKPEALFQFMYESIEESDAQKNGAYVLVETNDQVSVYEKNTSYASINGFQHPQIIEWKFPSSSEAARALINGEIDVVDRVNLSDLSRLQKTAGIEVDSYIVPTVHMLVPNIRNDFTRDRSFRNGLKQGINRELILNDVICGGNEVNGCEIISGPFPIGTEENDQLSYAYNLSVTPQPFNDRLGMVLARVIYETQINMLVRKGVKDPKVEFPTLVLAYPDESIPEMACTNIQQMWEAMGLKVVLRPLEPNVIYPDDDEWDFLYYEMSMEEPLTNADKLFGRYGVVKSVSAPVEQNMQKLGYSDSWQNAGKTLRRIHRQVVNDVTIIPLWQIKEHYAYRDNLNGMGRNPVHLYQHVHQWKIEPRTDQQQP